MIAELIGGPWDGMIIQVTDDQRVIKCLRLKDRPIAYEGQPLLTAQIPLGVGEYVRDDAAAPGDLTADYVWMGER